MKPLFVLLVLFNLARLDVYAVQDVRAIDSLKRLVNPNLKKHPQKPDTATINRIDRLADEYFESAPDSTLAYGKLEVKLAKQIGYEPGIARGSLHIAAVNTFRGDYDESAKNYNIALAIYLKADNTRGISAGYLGLGRIQDFLGNYDAALQYYKKSLAYCLKTADDADEAECYNYMGISYDSKGDLSSALDCYFKALFIDIKHNNNLRAADKYSNIGIIMQELELYPKALTYYNKALSLWQKIGDQQGISTGCLNIGDLYILQKQYDKGIVYTRKAYAIFNKMNDTEGLGMVYYDLGMYNYFTGHTDSALYYLKRALTSATNKRMEYNKAYACQGLSKIYNLEKNYTEAYKYALEAQQTGKQLHSLMVMTDATLQLSTALAGLHRYEEAYHEHEKYSELKSNLKHNESVNKVMLYNLEIDFNKKQKDFADRQHKKEVGYQQRIESQSNENLIAVAIIVVLAIVALIYYNAKSRQQRINRLLAEKNAEIVQQQENLNAQAAKLNELNILKDRLIGVLAHDLRAPISTLRGLFNLMNDDSITSEEFAVMTPKVFAKLEHTSDFLDTLLFWINSQVDGSENKSRNFSLRELVDREVAHLEDKIKQKGLTISLKIEADHAAFADPNCVRIVIHNFLTNAIKFSNRNDTIVISAWHKAGDGIVLCVKDQGVGMTTEYLQIVFKNHVTSNTGTENESGSGMGLLFCKDLIEKQNGRVWANSELGKGTELCFMLPMGKANEA